MPGRNVVKTYYEDGYYHLYNRGVDKRSIFMDQQDCKYFLSRLRLYLSTIEELALEAKDDKELISLSRRNLSKEVDLLAFALMPNHFHLQIRQHTKDGITKFMRRMLTSYSMYFNRKYKRIGALFEQRYKAVLVATDEQLLHLSRYIHLNPYELEHEIDFKQFTSLPYYFGKMSPSWIKPQEIVSYFSHFSSNKKPQGKISYENFVMDYKVEEGISLGLDMFEE